MAEVGRGAEGQPGPEEPPELAGDLGGQPVRGKLDERSLFSDGK